MPKLPSTDELYAQANAAFLRQVNAPRPDPPEAPTADSIPSDVWSELARQWERLEGLYERAADELLVRRRR